MKIIFVLSVVYDNKYDNKESKYVKAPVYKLWWGMSWGEGWMLERYYINDLNMHD